MAPRRLLPLVLVLLLSACPAPPVSAADDLLAQANAAYAQRGDLAQAQRAADLYAQALAANPKSEEAAYRLAMAWFWLGTNAPEGKDLEPFEKSVNAAKKAVEINPDSLPGHYWLGVAYGVYGKAKGIMKSLSLVDPIKEEMNWVLARDPNYEKGGPQRVLGRLYFKLPGLFGGDTEKAIANLKQAVQLGPDRWINHLYLAEVYLKEGEKAQAATLLKKIIAGPPEPGFEPEYKLWKAEAEKLLKESH
ncbi:MAG: TRAP transporter TatT component family protein [Desulfarculus sp.]|nr:TRAP transporter TatT component family protein [Desulfarculus sp.]